MEKEYPYLYEPFTNEIGASPLVISAYNMQEHTSQVLFILNTRHDTSATALREDEYALGYVRSL